MDRTTLLPVTFACLLLLAGCSGLTEGGGITATGPAATDPTTNAPTRDPGPSAGTSTATPTATPSPATTDATASPSETSTPSWSAPEPPNEPFQNKLDNPAGNRIATVDVVGGTAAREAGYSSFELRMTANTTMRRVDPADHGTVRGEPFFLLYVDGSLTNDSRFSYTNGTLLERSPLVAQEENGTFTVAVPRQALRERGVEGGTLEVVVLLMDRDTKWDDIYGYDTITVEYAPED